MPHATYDPDHIRDMVPGFHSALSANGITFLAGQVALDEKLEIVEGGLREQTRQALQNVGEVLHGAGGKPEDLVQLMIFYKHVDGLPVAEAVSELVTAKNEILPGSGPVGFACSVNELLYPELLVEIQAIAITS